MATIEALACWFNTYNICNKKHPWIIERINHSFLYSQLQGKQWIFEELKNIGDTYQNTAVIGGWFCHYLAHYLREYSTYICNYEIDPFVADISKTFNRYQVEYFDAIVKDLNIENFDQQHVERGVIGLVINTSCEHMHPFSMMKNRINKQLNEIPLYVLQSTDEDKYDDHINCVSGPEELAEQAEFVDIIYSGTKVLDNGMKRFMVIGR